MSETQVFEHGNGARRQSWKPDNPRDVLLKIIRDEDLSRDDAMEKAWHLVRKNNGLVRTIFEYWFANNYSSLKENSGWTPARLERARQERDDPAKIRAKADRQAQKAEIKRKLDEQSILISLDYMLPNNKAVRDCTGPECEQLAPRIGGWLMRVAHKVGSCKVGDVLNTEQLREIWRLSR